MVCAGCGQPLCSTTGRGRPARYHNAACRQRGRRARLASGHSQALELLSSLETAARELRHALLTDKDGSDPYARLAQTIRDLARHLGPTQPDPGIPDQVITKPVTKSVTPSSAEPSPVAGHRTDAPTRHPPAPEDSSQSATAPAVAKQATVKTVDLSTSIGPGWTLVQHQADRAASIWHLHHHCTPAGTVRRSYDLSTNARGWEARTARYDPVRASGTLAASRRGDRLWRTRDTAAAGIAAYLAHQQRGGRWESETKTT